MSSSLPPWANGPFELIVHAEGHLRDGEDFDRRMALITFDNAIEVSITTYLSLKPIMRGNRQYARTDVEQWLRNFHTRLDFLDQELQTRGLSWDVDKSHIIWAHDHRNEQYHGGSKGTPEKQVLAVSRRAALWIFSVLYDVPDAEQLLETTILELAPEEPQRNDDLDRLIDDAYDMVKIAESLYYPSEVLFAVDHDSYRAIGGELRDTPDNTDNEGAE